MQRVWSWAALVSLALVAFGVIGDGVEAAREYTLAYGMDKGATLAIQVEVKHRNNRVVMGNELTTNTKRFTQYGVSVLSAGPDGLVLEFEYAERKHETDDSLVVGEPDFSELIGRKARALLASTGVLSDFDGFGELPVIAMPGQSEPMGEQRYVNNVISLFPRLPQAPVAPGGTWSAVVEFHEPVQDTTLLLTVNTDYTLIEETQLDGHDCLKIEGAFTIGMSGPLDAGGLELELNIEGTGTETVYFAWKEGMVLRTESHSVLEGLAENQDMGVSVPMNHDITTVATVTLD